MERIERRLRYEGTEKALARTMRGSLADGTHHLPGGAVLTISSDAPPEETGQARTVFRWEPDDRSYLLELAERLRGVPVMYGVDGADIDRLESMARAGDSR